MIIGKQSGKQIQNGPFGQVCITHTDQELIPHFPKLDQLCNLGVKKLHGCISTDEYFWDFGIGQLCVNIGMVSVLWYPSIRQPCGYLWHCIDEQTISLLSDLDQV